MGPRRTGDGFVHCSDGQTRWGRFGAAGAVFVIREDDCASVLLQLRSQRAHQGGSWSCPGGALDEGETAFDGAWRESSEEIGTPTEPWRLVDEYVFEPASDWTYTTVVVEVGERFGRPLNFESDDVAWVPVDEVGSLSLHAGFAAAWPHLRAMIDGVAP